MSAAAVNEKTGSSGGNPDGSSYVPFADPLEMEAGKVPFSSSKPSSSQSSNHHTRQSFRQHLSTFWAMSLPYFRESRDAKCLFFGLVVLMLLDSAARIAFSYLARDFWSALGDKDQDAFYRIMRQFLVALCLLAPVNVFYRFQRQKLAIRWRQWMTQRILELYLYNPHRIYYRLEHAAGAGSTSATVTTPTDGSIVPATNGNFVDNPDQRLAEDVRSFTQFSLSLFLTVAISLIDLTAFSIVLYTIEPMLFASIVGFAACGTLAVCLLGKDLVRLNFQRLSKEADFRYSLVRIREHSESIAFFRGEHTEGQEVQRRFESLLANLYRMIGCQRNLEFFTVSYNYLTWILPVVVIAPQYMEGLVELGVVQQAARAFGNVLDDLSLIINQFEDLSEFSASIGRLHQFIGAIRDTDPDRGELSPLLGRPGSNGGGGGDTDGIFSASKTVPFSPGGKPTTGNSKNNMDESICLREYSPVSDASSHHGVALSIRRLFLETPSAGSERGARTLISNLDLDLQWGQKLLIMGPSGIGKSSLLRAIAGLWKSGQGWIERAHVSNVYFLPQKPYCPLGSLRDQLLYPFHSNDNDDGDGSATGHTPAQGDTPPPPLHLVDDSMLLEILQKVDLQDLAKRSGDGDPFRGLDTVLDWGNVLSLGEQQRLAFGRILVHQPQLVILDEATSAMDVPAEAKLYGLLRESTCVSVGHRPTLLRYHDTKLRLSKPGEATSDASGTNGSYTIGPIRSNADGVASEEVDLFFR